MIRRLIPLSQNSTALGGAGDQGGPVPGRNRPTSSAKAAFLALAATLSLLSSVAASFAQVPAPVPALPDAERRTSYAITSSTCQCNVNFAIFGDGNDYTNWIEVWVNGVQQVGNWTLSSPTGPLATIPRPITDAVLTFTAPQTGTVQIVGARRPRRTSQFQEGAGVTARNVNQVVTDIVAMLRENWDKTNDVTGRAVLARPGETLALLPILANRQNMGACFDNNGNLTSCVSVPSSTFAAGNGILFSGVNPTTITLGAGVDGNLLNAKTANYTIAPADSGSTIYATGGPFTITLPAVAGFISNATVNVCNGNANAANQHAVLMSGFPAPIFARLYPQQCTTVAIVGGAWIATKLPGRFQPTFAPTLFVDTSGSDSNDGLISNASTNALRNLQTCLTILRDEYYYKTALPTCSLTAGQTFNAATANGVVFGESQGSTTVVFIIGNGGMATITNTLGNVVLEMSDFGGYIIFDNINISCVGAASHQCIGIFIHQQNGIDLSTAGFLNGVTFTGAANTDTAISCDGMCKVNSSHAPLISGTFGNVFVMDQKSVLDLNAGLTINIGTTVGNIFQLTHGSDLEFSGQLTLGAGNSINQVLFASNTSNAIFTTFTLSGSLGGGGRQWAVLNNAMLCNASSIAIPGTAGTSSTTGSAAGIIVNSGVSGLCNP